jgi:hypothetical protein
MYLVLACIVFILSLIPVSVFPWLVRKSTILDLDLQMQKKGFVFVFFSSIQPHILCIKGGFGGIIPLRQ